MKIIVEYIVYILMLVLMFILWKTLGFEATIITALTYIMHEQMTAK